MMIVRQMRLSRFYIVKRDDPMLAWTGSRWAHHSAGIPVRDTQICNFDTEAEAQEYVDSLTRPKQKAIAAADDAIPVEGFVS